MLGPVMMKLAEPTTVYLPDKNGMFPTDQTHTLIAGEYEVVEFQHDFTVILDDPEGCEWIVMEEDEGEVFDTSNTKGTK